MVWARVALVSGLLLLLVGFASGTESRGTTLADGERYDCGAPIPASWLVAGATDQVDGRWSVPACQPVVRESRMGIAAVMGAGGLLALLGGTAIRERRPTSYAAVA